LSELSLEEGGGGEARIDCSCGARVSWAALWGSDYIGLGWGGTLVGLKIGRLA
jgi:hypothetical protein